MTIVYVLVGIVSTLVFTDAFLTLHGLSSGRIVEKNKAMRWFVRSPWRIYPFSALLCVGLYFAMAAAPWYVGVVVCVPLIIVRARICINNYRLNVRLM